VVPMHLGLIDRPFVPHNLISTKESPAPQCVYILRVFVPVYLCITHQISPGFCQVEVLMLLN
jgi:hypothetical protein